MPSVAPPVLTHDFNDDPAGNPDVAELQGQLDILTAWAANLSAALGISIRSDDTLTDALVRLRNLHPEVTATIAAGGIHAVASCRVVSTSNIALSGLPVIDGVTLLANDRVLVAGQTLPAQNGIYVAAAGAWTRATDLDAAADFPADRQVVVGITAGASYADSVWAILELAPVVGTDAITPVLLLGRAIGDSSISTVKLANDAVTNAKLANMAQYTVKGRISTGTGDPEDMDANDVAVIADGGSTRRDLSARFSDVVNVLDFGAVGDGVANDTAAIQAAIDYAQTSVQASGGISVPRIYFPAGTYLSGALTKKSGSWFGDGPDATMLVWAGNGTQDFVTVDSVASRGANSASELSGMSLYAGVDQPRDFLVIPSNGAGFGADYGFRVREVRFRGCDRYCVNAAGWVNFHMRSVRFDSFGSFAINLVAAAAQSLSTFDLSQWTADHMAGSAGEGFMRVDSLLGGTNVGIVAIRNGRYENNAALTGRKAFIVHVSNLSDQCQFVIDGVVYDDVGDITSGDALIYHDGTAGSESVMAVGFSPSNLAAMFGGTLPTDWPGQSIPVAQYGMLRTDRQAVVALPLQGSGANRGLAVYARDVGGAHAFRVWRKGDTQPRIELGADSAVKVGSGAATPSQVVGTRKTGWATATGTADRTTFATYTAPVISASPTQAEVQAIADHLQILSRRIKALIDDLHNTAGHGLIGT